MEGAETYSVEKAPLKPETQVEPFAHEEWAEIPVDRCRSCIESCRNGLIAAIASKGCAAKYHVQGTVIFCPGLFSLFFFLFFVF